MTAVDQPLPDVWFTRDLPVLRAIARLVDEGEHGGSPYLLGAVVPASGLPKADVIAAAKALAGAGYVDVLTNHAGEIVRCTGISPEARRLAGLWPTPQGEWDRLLQQLTVRADHPRSSAMRRAWRIRTSMVVRRSSTDTNSVLSSTTRSDPVGGWNARMSITPRSP